MPYNKTTHRGGYENEPGPRLDRKSPFESMMERFCYAAGLLNLHDRIFRHLAGQVKQATVSIPTVTDFGKIDQFKGYRVIHDNNLGPDRDIPARDMDPNEQSMAWIMDSCSMNKHDTENAVVTVSHFKWMQEKREDYCIKARVIRRLGRMMRKGFDNPYKVGEKYDIILPQAACDYAINTVVSTLKMHGICT